MQIGKETKCAQPMETALFQQRLHALHKSIKARREEELQFKILQQQQERSRKQGKTKRARAAAWATSLKRAAAYLFFLGSSSSSTHQEGASGSGSTYAKFAQADQLWEEDDDEGEQDRGGRGDEEC